jgi:hypothetical protein
MNYSDIYQQRQQIENEYRYRIQQLQQQEQQLRQSPYQSYEQMARPQSQVRSVSGIEEVHNIPAIPFETLYFSDSQNGRFYTKQIGVDGNAVIDVFVNERAKAEPKKAKPEDGGDIKKTMKALADIESRLAAIEKPVENKEAELEFNDERHTADT